MTFRPLANPVSAVLAFFLIAGSTPAQERQPVHEPLSEVAVRGLVEHLDRDLSDRLEHAARRSVSGKGLPPGFERQVVELRRRFETLQNEAAWLPEPARGIWLSKLDRLEPLLDNLEHTLAVGHARGVLPRRTLDRPLAESLPTDALAIRNPEPVPALAVAGADTCTSAPEIGFGTFSGNTTRATAGDAVSCGSSIFSPDVWFRFVVPASSFFELVSFDTFGSSFDTVLSLHSACPGVSQNLLQCSDDAFGTASLLTRFADGGEVFYVRVSGFDGAAGPFVLHVGAEQAAVSGRVSEEATGELQPSVSVELMNQAGFFSGFGFTDGSGSYTAGGLEGGVYVGRAEKSGFLAEFYHDVDCTDGDIQECFESATRLEVPGVGMLDRIDFTLSRGGVLSGRVTDAGTGEPVPNAEVDLFAGTSFIHSTFADSSGFYSFSGLPTGAYRAVAEQSSYVSQLYQGIPCPSGPFIACPLDSGTPIDVVAGATTSGIDFEMTQRGRISGVVRDASSSAAVSGALVAVFTPSGSERGSALTNAQGDYTIGGLIPGDYIARASASGYARELYQELPCPGNRFSGCDTSDAMLVSVTEATITTGIDFTLTPRGTLSGQVTAAVTGAPQSSFNVVVLDSTGAFFDDTFTLGDGTYSIELDPGTYFVRTDEFFTPLRNELFDDVPCHSSCSIADGTPVVITSGDETPNVDFALEAVASLSGRVTRAAEGTPVDGAQVELYSRFGSFAARTTTDASGNYSFPVQPETYFVVTRADAPLVGEVYDGASCAGFPSCEPELDGTPIRVRAGDHLTGIDFALEEASSLGGTVTDIRTGNVLVGHEVDLWSSRGRLLKAVLTATGGTYGFTGLGPGTYFVSTRGASADLVDEVYRDVPCLDDGTVPACDVTKGTAVLVTHGGQTVDGIDFHLDPITGPVTHIFSDGFESRDLSAWTVVVP